MKSQIATGTKIINAPAERIYVILADYRNHHPRILPKLYFLSLEMESFIAKRMLQKVYAQELEQLARLAAELNGWNQHSISAE